jgi:hypothetical protein
MAQKLDDREMVSFKELLMANLADDQIQFINTLMTDLYPEQFK